MLSGPTAPAKPSTAVVVARKAAHVVDFDGLRPRFTVIGGAHKLNLGVVNRSARPPNIGIARKRTVTSVPDEIGLVFPRDSLAVGGFVGLLGGGDVFDFPGLASVE